MQTTNEQVLTKRERKALRRAEKQQLEKSHGRKKQITVFAVLISIAGLAVLLLYAGYAVLLRGGDSKDPNEKDFSSAISVMPDKGHISVGSPRPAYNSNPPTSGPHYAQTAERGVHKEELADESLVHNLEHGEVWISYQPDVVEAVVKELEDITRANTKVVLTIRSANEKDIALSAWGRLDTFDVSSDGTIDRARIENFIKRYRNKGPEAVP